MGIIKCHFSLRFKWNEEQKILDFFHHNGKAISSFSGFKYFDVMFEGMKSAACFMGVAPMMIRMRSYFETLSRWMWMARYYLYRRWNFTMKTLSRTVYATKW